MNIIIIFLAELIEGCGTLEAPQLIMFSAVGVQGLISLAKIKKINNDVRSTVTPVLG